MALLIVTIFFQVINRFALHIPMIWTEEAGRYVFIWVCLFGTVKALQSDKHIKIEVLGGILNEKQQRYLNLISDLMTLIFSIFLTWTGWIYTISGLHRNWEFGPIPIYPVYAILPITGALMVFESILIIIRRLKGKDKIGDSDEILSIN